MTEWIYPAGDAPQGPWFCSLGAHDSATHVAGWKHTGIRVGDLDDGASVTLDAARRTPATWPNAA